MSEPEQGIQAAREMVAEGIQLIDAIDYAVPVGVVAWVPSSHQREVQRLLAAPSHVCRRHLFGVDQRGRPIAGRTPDRTSPRTGSPA